MLPSVQGTADTGQEPTVPRASPISTPRHPDGARGRPAIASLASGAFRCSPRGIPKKEGSGSSHYGRVFRCGRAPLELLSFLFCRQVTRNVQTIGPSAGKHVSRCIVLTGPPPVPSDTIPCARPWAVSGSHASHTYRSIKKTMFCQHDIRRTGVPSCVTWESCLNTPSLSFSIR